VHPPALQRCRRAALHVEVEFEDVRGALDGGARIPDVLHEVGRDIVSDTLVDGVPRGAGRGDTDDGREDVIGDDDAVADVLRDIAVAGDDHYHRLTDVVDLLADQGITRARRVQRGVRDEQRQRLGHPPRQILPGVDGDQAVDVQGRGHVDVDDAGVGVRAPDERGGDRALVDVVGIAAAAGHQAQILAALHGRTDAARGHDAPSRTSSAARSVAAIMF
jgi:hypothetical protein